jgi:SOS-response transcriptional repressor LexA
MPTWEPDCRPGISRPDPRDATLSATVAPPEPVPLVVPDNAISAATRDFIFRRLFELRMEQKDLAAAIGVDGSTLSRLLGRKRGASLGTLRKIAVALEVGEDMLLRPTSATAAPRTETDSISHLARTVARLKRDVQDLARRQPLVQVPVAGRVHAGAGGGLVEAVVYVPRQEAEGRALLAVEVRGDCMEPEIHAGDTAIVDLDASPQNGDLVAARLPDTEDYVVKRFYRRKGAVELHSNDGEPVVFPADRVEVAGVVFGTWRPLTRRVR